MSRKEQMTGKERIEALYQRKLTDRVPIVHKGYAFCARNVGYHVAEIYNNPKKSFAAQEYTFEQYGFDGGPFYTFIAYGAGEFGGEIKFPEDKADFGPSVKTRPVQNPEDFAKLTLPDPRTSGCIPDAMEFARIQAEKGYEIAFICGTPFTHTANLCGVENFLMWTVTHPEMAG
jgi:uroporphyrinogen-III decarboxylase